jgi:hypothetical protein
MDTCLQTTLQGLLRSQEAGKVFEISCWQKMVNQTNWKQGFPARLNSVRREILRIQKIGRFWTYIPIINKGKPVMFTLIESEPGVWIFENKEHDFPQRVVYSQKTDGSLFAWIEGEQKGQFMKDEYAMQKVN